MEFEDNFFYRNEIELMRYFFPDIYALEIEKRALLITSITEEINYDCKIKTLIIGNIGIGKTSSLVTLKKSINNFEYVSSVENLNLFDDATMFNKLTKSKNKLICIDEIDKLFYKLNKNMKFENKNIIKSIFDDRNNSLVSVGNLGNYLDISSLKLNNLMDVISIFEEAFPLKYLEKFEIIIFNKDEPNRKNDDTYATFKLEETKKSIYSMENIEKYLNLIKKCPEPSFSKEAKIVLYEIEKELKRKIENEPKLESSKKEFFQSQLLGIINTSKIFAVLNLRKIVEIQDIKESVKFSKELIEENLSYEGYEEARKIEKDYEINEKDYIRNSKYFELLIRDCENKKNGNFSELELNKKRNVYPFSVEIYILIDDFVNKGKIIEVEKNTYRRSDW